MSCDLDPKAPAASSVSPRVVTATNVAPAPPPASSSSGADKVAPEVVADSISTPGPATSAASLRPTTVCGFLE